MQSNAAGNVHIPDNETLTSDVNSGTVAIGIINQYYYYRLKTEVGPTVVGSQFAFFAPHDPGYLENISGAAVLGSSKNQAAAQKFLQFLISPSGQTVLATSDSFEYPLANGVAASPQLPPLNTLAPNAFSVANLGTGEDAKALLQQAQLL